MDISPELRATGRAVTDDLWKAGFTAVCTAGDAGWNDTDTPPLVIVYAPSPTAAAEVERIATARGRTVFSPDAAFHVLQVI